MAVRSQEIKSLLWLNKPEKVLGTEDLGGRQAAGPGVQPAEAGTISHRLAGGGCPEKVRQVSGAALGTEPQKDLETEGSMKKATGEK